MINHILSLTRQSNDAAVSGFEGVRFYVNSTTAANSGTLAGRFTSTGNFGIGTTVPTAKVEIKGGPLVSNNENYFGIRKSTDLDTSPYRFWMTDNQGSSQLYLYGQGTSECAQIRLSDRSPFAIESAWFIDRVAIRTTLFSSAAMTIQTSGELFLDNTGAGASFTNNTKIRGGELLVYKNTYTDPMVGTGFTAKFGSTSENGICVKGNSRFIDSCVANNFSTNSIDYFTYEEQTFTPYLAFHQLGYNANGLIVTDITGWFNFWSYTTQLGKIVRIGNLVTISWNLEFSYANNVYGLFMILPINFAQFRSAYSGGAAFGFPNNLVNLTNATNYSTLAAIKQNISYNGNPAVGLAAVGRETTGNGFYMYYSGGSTSTQRFVGSMSYVI